MDDQNVDAKAWSTLEWIRATPRIAIPVYQREYRWSQSTCDTLLQDVRHIAAQEPDQTHFLGSILAKPDRGGGVTLVDGQQRITTLMLLVAAIGARAREVLGSEPAGLRELLTDGRDPLATRLVPHERSAAEFHQLVLGSQGGEVDDSTNAFGNNYAFLAERIRDDWLLVWEGLARLEHVTIELKAAARAEQIFESLNSKGAALADDELIHNYVHMGRDYDQQVELERDTWLPIEEATEGSTREFWRDYLILTSDTVPDFSGDFGVYRAFKARYPYPKDDVTTECKAEWRRYAECYRAMLNPEVEPDPLVAKQLRFLQTFGGTPRPLILAVYDDFRQGDIDVNTAVSTFEQLQTMLMRRSLVGGARDLHRIAGLCRELAADGYPIAGIVTHTPKDALMRRTLVHAGLPHATYALRRLQFDDRIDLDLQVEHIYPQTPDKDWSGAVGTTKWGDLTSDEQAEYRALLHTAGNLTLLEADLNQGAGNRPFVEKSGYFRQSAVPETKALADLPLWNPGAIQDRTRDLTARFLTVWPRRSDAPESEDDDLVSLADVPRPDLRGYPEAFEYAEFNGEPWEFVRTSKQLFVRLVNELCARDEAMVESSSLGRLVVAERTPHVSYEKLNNGKWVYAGLWHSYMLGAVESALADFGLEGQLRVKLAAPLD